MPLGTASASHGATGLLDRLQFGVVLYAHDGWIASLNRHAADLLARSRSLTLRGEALHCHDAVQRGRLAQLLADGRAGRGRILQIEAAGDPPLTLLTVPLAPAASAPQDAPGEPDVLRFALVFGMRDVSSRAALDAFSALYQLTPAEGRVLEAFVRDRSPRGHRPERRRPRLVEGLGALERHLIPTLVVAMASCCYSATFRSVGAKARTC